MQVKYCGRMKRAFIIHGWKVCSRDNWFPWLGRELERLGYAVTIPDMPHTAEPDPGEWVSILKGLVGKPDGETVLIGHSLGAHAVMRYLEQNGVIGLAALVSPWPNPNAIKDSKYSRTANRWMKTDPDWESIRKNSEAIIAMFSTDDPFVMMESAKLFKDKLSAQIIIGKERGHIIGEQLPEILECIRVAEA